MNLITGLTAAVAVIAVIVSIKSYVRVRAMKALDLRLELQKSFNDLDVILSGVEGYLDFVRESHMRVLAATGLNLSGEMKLFEEEYARDEARLRGLLRTQPRREVDYRKYAPDALEEMLVAVHALRVQVADIRGKYQRLLEADGEQREEIRQRHG